MSALENLCCHIEIEVFFHSSSFVLQKKINHATIIIFVKCFQHNLFNDSSFVQFFVANFSPNFRILKLHLTVFF
jgi:hypothetical protein